MGQPDMRFDPSIQERKEQLLEESKVTIESIRSLANSSSQDPLIDPAILSRAVDKGILDAPQLRNNPFARGMIKTRIIEGACISVDNSGKKLSEHERLTKLGMP
jgi:hypothetical protein